MKLPQKVIQRLKEGFVLYTTKVVQEDCSIRGDTVKLLVELQDGHKVETVVMKYKSRATVCVSSQIGCAMGCKFCATGTMGIIGNLTEGEIIEQFIHANNVHMIRNVVFMGMGEPMNNYDSVARSLSFLLDPKRFGLSASHITVSTVGVIKNIRRFADDFPAVSLALSLHAPDQETRLKIVPSASTQHIDRLLEAIDYYVNHPSRGAKKVEDRIADKGSATQDSGSGDVIDEEDDQSAERANSIERFIMRNSFQTPSVMIEYILIKGINDSASHARALGQLLFSRRRSVLVNLIPYNPTSVGERYEAPEEESVETFSKICQEDPYFLHCRVRQEMGQDIAGACGQLAVSAGANDIEEVAGGSGSGCASCGGGGSCGGGSCGCGEKEAPAAPRSIAEVVMDGDNVAMAVLALSLAMTVGLLIAGNRR